MTGRATLILALLVAALFTGSYEARADTLTFTGGSLSQRASGPVQYSFVGQNFTANGLGADFGSHTARCTTCEVGSAITITVTFTASDLGGGSATINGVSYPALSFRGSIEFVSTGLIAPPPDPAFSIIEVTAPFTMSGSLRAYQGNPDFSPFPLTPIFSSAVSGQGMATFQLIGLGGFGRPPYTFLNMTLNFQPAPIPEPATLLLLGTGLAGVAARARRRKAKRQPTQS